MATAATPGTEEITALRIALAAAEARADQAEAELAAAHVLARIAGQPVHRLDALLPWNWKPPEPKPLSAAA
jgi:transposase